MDGTSAVFGYPATPDFRPQNSAELQSQGSMKQPHSSAALVKVRAGLEQGASLVPLAYSHRVGSLGSLSHHFHGCKSRTASLFRSVHVPCGSGNKESQGIGVTGSIRSSASTGGSPQCS